MGYRVEVQVPHWDCFFPRTTKNNYICNINMAEQARTRVFLSTPPSLLHTSPSLVALHAFDGQRSLPWR